MLASSLPGRFQKPHKWAEDGFTRDVLSGLAKPRKSLPCRYFYDARGSELFEQITKLPEYYPTRCEREILANDQLLSEIQANTVLVEFGSGSSRKTELLLRQMPIDTAYVAIDVSIDALREAGSRLASRFPRLDIRLIVADFATLGQLPVDLATRPKIGFFPGSTIGNLIPREATRLLRRFRGLLSPSSRMLVGVDLKKDVAVLEAAYNDSTGVTAAFNRNILHRINREIAPAFDVTTFEHAAVFNDAEGRIEMHLVSSRDHIVSLCGEMFAFHAGETIHTESSYKYAVAEFQHLARNAGWQPKHAWTDPAGLFSVHELAQ